MSFSLILASISFLMVGTLVPALVWLIANLTRPPAFGRYGRVEGPIAYAVDVACVTLAIVLFASMLWAMRRAQIARVALATSIGAFLVILIALGSMAMPDARTSSTIDVSGQSSHIRSFYRVYGRDLMPLDWWRRRSVVRDEYGPPAPDGLLLDPYGLGWEEHGLPLRFIQTPRYYGIARPDRIGLLDSIPNILGMSRIRPLALGLNIAAFALAILLMGRVLAAFARRRRALSVPRSDASSD